MAIIIIIIKEDIFQLDFLPEMDSMCAQSALSHRMEDF